MQVQATPEEITEVKRRLDAGEPLDGEYAPLATFLTGLGGATLRTTTGDATFRTNLETELARNRDRSAYTNVEAEWEKLTGVKKNANEKTTDYLARVYQEKVVEVGKSKTPTEREQELQRALDAQKLEHETYKTNAAKELVKQRAAAEVDAAYEGVRGTLAEMPAAVLEDVKAARLARFFDTYEPELDGDKLVYRNKQTGNRELDTANSAAPFNTAALVGRAFADLKKPDQPAAAGAAGAGGGKAPAAGAPGTAGAPAPAAAGAAATGLGKTARPPELKTQADVFAHLKGLGLNNKSKEFNEAWAAWTQNEDGTRLPEA